MRLEDGTYDNDIIFQSCYDKYFTTGNIRDLWEAYEPIRHAVKSLLIKKHGGFTYDGIDDDTMDGVIEVVKRIRSRYERGEAERIRSLITYCYYALLRCQSKDEEMWKRNVVREADMPLDIGLNNVYDYDHMQRDDIFGSETEQQR